MADPDLLLLRGPTPVPIGGTASISASVSAAVARGKSIAGGVQILVQLVSLLSRGKPVNWASAASLSLWSSFIKGRPLAAQSSSVLAPPLTGDEGFDPGFVELDAFQTRWRLWLLSVSAFTLLASALQAAAAASFSLVRTRFFQLSVATALSISAALRALRLISASIAAALSAAAAMVKYRSLSAALSLALSVSAAFVRKLRLAMPVQAALSAVPAMVAKFRMAAQAAASLSVSMALNAGKFISAAAQTALAVTAAAKALRLLKAPVQLSLAVQQPFARVLRKAAAAVQAASVITLGVLIKARPLKLQLAGVLSAAAGVPVIWRSLKAAVPVAAFVTATLFHPLKDAYLLLRAGTARARILSKAYGSSVFGTLRRAGTARFRWRP